MLVVHLAFLSSRISFGLLALVSYSYACF